MGIFGDGEMKLSCWAVLVLALGCDPSPATPRCVTGADCASGTCLADGRCAPPQDAGLEPRDGGPPPAGDARVPPGEDAGPSGLCRPNADGVIQRAEAPFGPDLMARYVVARDVGVNTAGADLGDGRRRWDYEGALPGDRDLDLDTAPLDGRWFADRYVGADYVARLTGDADLLGVFRVTASALELMGVVSPTDGAGRTELTYDPPVRILVFPLEAGSRWTTESRVTGWAQGLAANYTETYENEVDARGEVVTPYAPFEALRVRVTLTRDLTFDRTTVRQFLFVAECFGTVATVVSEEDETDTEFDRAAEIRRLGF